MRRREVAGTHAGDSPAAPASASSSSLFTGMIFGALGGIVLAVAAMLVFMAPDTSSRITPVIRETPVESAVKDRASPSGPENPPAPVDTPSVSEPPKGIQPIPIAVKPAALKYRWFPGAAYIYDLSISSLLHGKEFSANGQIRYTAYSASGSGESGSRTTLACRSKLEFSLRPAGAENSPASDSTPEQLEQFQESCLVEFSEAGEILEVRDANLQLPFALGLVALCGLEPLRDDTEWIVQSNSPLVTLWDTTGTYVDGGWPHFGSRRPPGWKEPVQKSADGQLPGWATPPGIQVHSSSSTVAGTVNSSPANANSRQTVDAKYLEVSEIPAFESITRRRLVDRPEEVVIDKVVEYSPARDGQPAFMQSRFDGSYIYDRQRGVLSSLELRGKVRDLTKPKSRLIEVQLLLQLTETEGAVGTK